MFAFVFYFVELPDPFAKISVDGSGQCHSTDTCKATLDPKWNQHYDLYVLPCSVFKRMTIRIFRRSLAMLPILFHFAACFSYYTFLVQSLGNFGYRIYSFVIPITK